MAGTELEDGFVRRGRALEQELDPAAGRTRRPKPRLDHARVVEQHQIPGRQESGQVGKSPIEQRRAVHVQQPAARARRGRHLRDQLGRQRVVEIGKRVAFHCKAGAVPVEAGARSAVRTRNPQCGIAFAERDPAHASTEFTFALRSGGNGIARP